MDTRSSDGGTIGLWYLDLVPFVPRFNYLIYIFWEKTSRTDYLQLTKEILVMSLGRENC